MEVYGNVVEIPVYNQIEETNEIYFSIKVKTIEQNIINFALASSVDNDYEKYELNRPIYAYVIENEYGLKIANKIEFITQRDLIDKALNNYRNKEISLEQYIQVCKDNKTYTYENIEDEREQIEYNKKVIRQPLDNNNYQAKGEIIKGYSEEELYRIIENYLKEMLVANDINTDIVNFQIIGSRNKGIANAKSDLDVLIEYNNDYISEDSLFNILNDDEDRLIINNIEVDFNPITPVKSGTLEEWLERNYNYDKHKNEKIKLIYKYEENGNFYYEDEKENLYCENGNQNIGKVCLWYCTKDYGEPIREVENLEKYELVNNPKDDPNFERKNANKFDYMMLSRLQSDCDYFLKNGNGFVGHLYYKDVDKHIEEMKKIYNSFSDEEKPEWITLEEIDNYKDKMNEMLEKDEEEI